MFPVHHRFRVRGVVTQKSRNSTPKGQNFVVFSKRFKLGSLRSHLNVAYRVVYFFGTVGSRRVSLLWFNVTGRVMTTPIRS